MKLKMPEWLGNVKNELKRDTAIEAFYSDTTNDLLGEEFTMRSMSFDGDDGKISYAMRPKYRIPNAWIYTSVLLLFTGSAEQTTNGKCGYSIRYF